VVETIAFSMASNPRSIDFLSAMPAFPSFYKNGIISTTACNKAYTFATNSTVLFIYV
jgi:hypothetical protein